MKLFLLAAGLGTRLAPVTNKIPKPAVPLLTVPMIFYPFYNFDNVSRVLINSFHLPEVLKLTLLRQARNFSAEMISDGPKLLGSGGGIKNAEAFLRDDGSFSVANSDAVFLADASTFLEKAKRLHHKNQAIATMVVIEDKRVEEKGWGAVWTDDSDRILAIGKKKPDQAKKGYHFVGYWILDDSIFSYLPGSKAIGMPISESNIFDDAILPAQKAGRTIQIYKTTGQWFETGNSTEYLEATGILLKEYAKGNKFLRTLLRNFSPHHKFHGSSTSTDFLLTADAYKIETDVKLEGFVVVGNEVTIESGCHIKNSVILDNVKVPKNSKIENQILF